MILNRIKNCFNDFFQHLIKGTTNVHTNVTQLHDDQLIESVRVPKIIFFSL
jgi:hypothetical protein